MNKLTASLICREFVRLLAICHGPIEFSEEPVSLNDNATQRHIDVWLDPAELEQSLDDMSERILHPCADVLSRNMQDSGAAVCFYLDLPERDKRPDLHCSVQRRDGFSVRCLLNDPKFDLSVPEHARGKYSLRLDILFRDKRQSQAVKSSRDRDAVIGASI